MASPAIEKMKEIVTSGVLETLIHFSGFERLAAAHGAAFMRRFHRHSNLSGGLCMFTPDKQPSPSCGVCPIQNSCPDVAKAGFVFPIGGADPIYHKQSAVYGGSLCVYSPDKDLVDHQLLIRECEDGLLEFDSQFAVSLKLTNQTAI